MDSNLVLGIVVSALTVLVGLFASLATPLIKLNKTIQRLNDQLDKIEERVQERDKQLVLLHDEVNKHSVWLKTDKLRLDNQSKRLQKIDGEVGVIDNDKRD